MRISVVLSTLAALSLTACGQELGKTPIPVNETAPEQPTAPVEKSDKEWREQLTPEQYVILREDGTEPPNGPLYKAFKKHGDGTYYCAGCGAELFSSDTKFDSRSGWPSFWDVANAKNIRLTTDQKLGYTRTEVRCGICDGHLGHLFKGERYGNPKDNRYCINGTALTFTPKK